MILFTADWHIKLGQKNVPVEWALARYREFFKQVHAICKNMSLHIIGGDLFDRMPTLEEEALYYEFVSQVEVPTIIYDGNHEATKKNQTFFDTLKDTTRRLNPLVTIVTTTYEEDSFSILPYADLHKKGSIESLDSNKPLFTHVRGEILPHVKPEVDLDRFADFPIVFAGDLHAHSNCQRNIVYPGSPLTTSFHRSIVETGYIIINPGTFEWFWYPFELPQLLRKTIDNWTDMLPTDYHHTIYELCGDLQDLAAVNNSDLLDKKVVKRNTETALVLSTEMTIVEELAEYLEYILMLSEDKVSDILGTFNDYT
jgi:DNA repair exonuclease SbcCD nuclease subunit